MGRSSWRPSDRRGAVAPTWDGADAPTFPRAVAGVSVELRPLELHDVETMFMVETGGGTRWSPMLGAETISLSQYQRAIASCDGPHFVLVQADQPIGRAYLTEHDPVARHASCVLSIGPEHRAPRTILEATLAFGCEAFRTTLISKLYFDVGVAVGASTIGLMDRLLDDEGHKRNEFLRDGQLVDRRIRSISRPDAASLVRSAGAAFDGLLEVVGIG